MKNTIKDYHKKLNEIITHEGIQNGIRTVQLFIIGFIILLITWDVFLILNDTNTISQEVKNYSNTYHFILPWIWGVLGGHLFLAQKGTKVILNEKLALIVLISLCVLLFSFNSVVPVGYISSNNFEILILSIGVLSGYLIWPIKFNYDKPDIKKN